MVRWMDWLFLFRYCGLIWNWNKFLWLFEIACLVCLDRLAWEFFVLIRDTHNRSTFTTFPLHMNALFGFLRGPNDLYAVICVWGNCILQFVVCLLEFSHFWHRQMHTHYTHCIPDYYYRKPGNDFQYSWMKRGIIKESATFDGWTYISIAQYLGTWNIWYFVRVK